MTIFIRIFKILLPWMLAICSASISHAQERTCFLCNVEISDAAITGPSTTQGGTVDSWTGSAKWTFDYDLLPGETINFSASALTFPEFTPPDYLRIADINPYTKIICEPDCKGHGEIIVSFTATGAFEPDPGKTTQNIYLIPEATLNSPAGINVYDLPIAVPEITITVNAVPEPATMLLTLCGLLIIVACRNLAGNRTKNIRRGELAQPCLRAPA